MPLKGWSIKIWCSRVIVLGGSLILFSVFFYLFQTFSYWKHWKRMKWNMSKASLKKSTWVSFSCSSLFSDCCWSRGFSEEWLTAQRRKPDIGNPESVHRNLMSPSFLGGRSPLHTWRKLEARQGAPGQETAWSSPFIWSPTASHHVKPCTGVRSPGFPPQPVPPLLVQSQTCLSALWPSHAPFSFLHRNFPDDLSDV